MSVAVVLQPSDISSSSDTATTTTTSSSSSNGGDMDVLDRAVLFECWPQKSAHVVEELIMTEKSYIESLREIIDGYLIPLYEFLLQGSQGPDFIQVVFCNIRKLHDIHQQIFNNFLLLYKNPSEFACIFEQNIDNFKEYTQYCINFPNCEHTLQKTLKSSPSTQEFIVKCQLGLGHPLPLITYLHKPVQRILKYKLLLEQILKGFDDNKIGHKELQSALTTMSNVNTEINEVKKRQENLKRVKSIEKQLKGLKGSELSDKSLQSYGHLVLEENCKVLGRKGGERLFLLFQKMLLFLKKKVDNSFIYKGLIMIEELDLFDQPSRGPNVVKMFSICSTSKKFIVELRSKKAKEELIRKIQELLVLQIERNKEKIHKTTPETEKKASQSKVPRLTYQRGKDLQLRRATRQESTKKYSSTEKSFDAEESNLMSTTSTSDSGISVSDVSSVSQSLLEEEESPRFKRKLAYRRKKLHTISAPDIKTAQSSLRHNISDMDEDVSILEFESSLDRAPRDEVFETKPTIEDSFIYPEDYHERRATLPAFRTRADVYLIPPDPCEVLGKDKILGSSAPAMYEEGRPPALSEQDEKLFEHIVNRRSIYSRNLEDSLGSNESSLCLEDHYMLSRTPKSTVIAGKDGENFVIIDDTDDSDSEYVSDEEEEEEKATGTDNDEDKKKDDIVLSSLRSYISMAKHSIPPGNNSSFDSQQVAISPLATLPRGVVSSGLLPPLLTQNKRTTFQKHFSVDVIQSLPQSLPVETSSHHDVTTTGYTTDITGNTDTTTISNDIANGTDISSEITPSNDPTMEDLFNETVIYQPPTTEPHSNTTINIEDPLLPSDEAHNLSSLIEPLEPVSEDIEIANILPLGESPYICDSPINKSPNYDSSVNVSPICDSPINISSGSLSPVVCGPTTVHHYRSSSVPPYLSQPLTRPVYNHWTPSPSPMSHDESHNDFVIDLSSFDKLSKEEKQREYQFQPVIESEFRQRGVANQFPEAKFEDRHFKEPIVELDLAKQWRDLLMLTGKVLNSYISLRVLLIICVLLLLLVCAFIVTICYYIVY